MIRTTAWLGLAALLAAPLPARATTTTDTQTTLHHHIKTTTTTVTTEKPGSKTITVTTRKTLHGKTITTHTTTTTNLPPHQAKLAHPTPAPLKPPAPHHHKHPTPPIAAGPIAKPAPALAAPPPTPAAPPPPPPDPAKGSVTGLPIPRFAALRSDRVNLRTGPGTRYPIDWVYTRRDLPVEIEREYEVWRLISEPDGTKGWVHLATLTGRRSFLITGDQPQTLHAAANDTSPPVAILKPGVVGHLISCAPTSDWCTVEVKTYHGYLNRSAFWGVLPGEGVGQ